MVDQVYYDVCGDVSEARRFCAMIDVMRNSKFRGQKPKTMLFEAEMICYLCVNVTNNNGMSNEN